MPHVSPKGVRRGLSVVLLLGLSLASFSASMHLAASAAVGAPLEQDASSETPSEEPWDDDETQSKTARIEGLRVAIWAAPIDSGKRLPLIVFSHGFTACRRSSSFLTSSLAKAGYVVAAPEHRDSSCDGPVFLEPEAPFAKPAAWNERTYRRRGRDIVALVEGLKADPEWSALIDPARIGLMGHSLGGYAALALAGARPSWPHTDAKAVLALAPLIGPLLKNGSLENIRVPVMYQAGSRDHGTTALIKKRGGAFDRTKHGYYAEIKGADHFAWSGGKGRLERPIAALSAAFFDAELKGKPFAAAESPAVVMLKRK